MAQTRFVARETLNMTAPDVHAYPRSIICNVEEVEIRYMTAADEAPVLTFARQLPSHDLLFLRRDISQQKVVAAWIRDTQGGAITSLVALRSSEVVGCASLISDELSWSPHVCELRVVVAPEMRGKGLGRALTQECFTYGLSRGMEKIVAHMTVDQKAAILVFEQLGFRAEALLRDHVKDRDGRKHDLAILSHDVVKFRSKMDAYGVVEAF
jgi:RimJ/RimL family protein N-acetyltransferase